jgi:hypothetical protein
MIVKKTKKGTISVYIVDKEFDDNKLKDVLNKHVKPNQIHDIIDEDADVYTADHNLLLRFRKNKLNKKNYDNFYENVIDFAITPTSNRGSASEQKNIIGFFDTRQKFIKTLKTTVRECRFNMDNPEKYKKLLPLVKQIDQLYKKYLALHHKLQKKKADQTPFKIEGTSFTTITTNVNFQTTVHTDNEGFGNLAVIEHGKYKGGETCFPQYGIGVDVRSGDILFMDVHEPHGNLPVILETPDAKRLSIVCYLRKNIWEKTKGKTKKFMIAHNNIIKNARKTKKHK